MPRAQCRTKGSEYIKKRVVGFDLEIAARIAVRFGIPEITAGGDPRVSAALHIGGQAVAEDDYAAFIRYPEVVEDIVEICFVRL